MAAPRPARVIQSIREEKRAYEIEYAEVAALRAAKAKASERLHALNGEAQTLMVELERASIGDELRHRHNERAEALGSLRVSLSTVERALAEGLKHADGVDARLAATERSLAERDARLLVLGEAEPGALTGVEVAAERSLVKSQVLVETEAAGAASVARALVARAGAAVAAGAAARDAAAATLERSRAIREGTSAMAATQAALRSQLAAEGGALRAAALDAKLDAVLSLKGNLELVHAEINAGNDAVAAARVRRDAERAAEYAALSAQGLNPYEVWRARERDARAAAALERHEESVDAAKLAAVERVVVEDEAARAVEAAAARRREALDDVRRAKARGVAEAHTAAYLQARIVGGGDTLDPLGRAAARGVLYPSAVTLVRPPGWGTGAATAVGRPDILAHAAGAPGMEGVAPFSQWVPREEGADAGEVTITGGAVRAEAGAGAGDGGGDGAGAAALSRTRVVGVGASGRNAYALRPLSKYEASLAAAALARTRANLTRPQVAAGRAFSGAGFICEPPELLFKDFKVGVPMTLSATLTNSSFTFNSFRFEELPPALRDLFRVEHAPPGRMSAGLSVPFSVTFSPVENADIDATLVVFAQTGPVPLPLRATVRKALPVVRQPLLDVGAVTLGESGRGHLTVENEGVVPIDVTVAVRAAPPAGSSGDGEGGGGGGEEDAAVAQDGDPNADAFSFPATLHVPGYGRAALPFTFSPASIGAVALPVELAFAVAAGAPGGVPADAALVPPPQPLHCLVTGAGYPLPLYVEEEVVDFRVAVVGKLYRAHVTVRNRGSVTAPVQLRLPPALVEAGVVTVSPLSGYAQPTEFGVPGRFTFEVTFRPSEALLRDPAALGAAPGVPEGGLPGGPGNSGGEEDVAAAPAVLALAPPLTIPLEVVSPAQVLSVPVALFARVTPAALHFEPDAPLDFGSTLVGNSVALPLALTNASAYPQKYAFPRVPEGFAVDPGGSDGFGLLLPGASAALTVVFTPPAPGTYAGRLHCLSSLNSAFDIPLRGEAAPAPMALSASALLLAATAVGEAETVTVTLRHAGGGAGPLDFHVSAPTLAGAATEEEAASAHAEGVLTVLPANGTLAPGASTTLAVRFAPTAHFFEGALPAQAATAAALLARSGAEGAEGEGGGGGGSEGEGADAGAGAGAPPAPALAAPPAVHHQWLSSVFVRPHDERAARAAEALEDDGRGPPPEALPLQRGLLLAMTTTALPRMLSAEPAALSFGAVAVGHVSEAVVTLHNASPVAMAVEAAPLPAEGGFKLLTPLAPHAPGASVSLRLAFAPTAHRIFVARFAVGIAGEGPRVAVALSGTGVAPALSIAPPRGGAIDFGALLQGDLARRAFALRNPTPFPMPFRLRCAGAFPAQGVGAPTALPPLSLSPTEGVVPPGGEVRVEAVFSPRAAPPCGRPFAVALDVEVPHARAESRERVFLLGRASCTSLLLMPPPPSGASAVEAAVEEALAAGAAGSAAVAEEDAAEEGSPLVGLGGAGGCEEDAFRLEFSGGGVGGAGARRRRHSVSWASPPPRAGAGARAGGAEPVTRELRLLCIDRGAEGVEPCEGSGAGVAVGPPHVPGAPQTPATFRVVLPPPASAPGGRPSAFSVAPEAGTLAPGKEVALVFTFAPAPGGERGGGALRMPGQWQEVEAVVHLSGGVAVTGAPQERAIPVLLRAFLPGTV